MSAKMRAVAAATLVVALTPALFGAAASDSAAHEILIRRCLACHSAQLKTGGLSLATRAEGARVIQSGALLERVAAGKMPPAAPLPESEIAALRAWVADGARWPEAGGRLEPRRAGADWWSLQPLRDPGPAARGIDAWLGTQSAPSADRRALIRRVTYGLTGIAPTPEEVADFLADSRPDAYPRLVDRLLASPRYGEHWARHWLDVARYAESEGFERDWLRDHAWPYRDYVIRSLNADKPYPEFAREQIAGDVLPNPTHDSLIATSFLALGPYDAVGLTSAVPQEREQVREDQLEEIVGAVSQTFLGLTVNCARCHNHKFDPIPQSDYYRLKAVFAGVWQPTAGTELKADGREILTPGERSAREAERAAAKTRVETLATRLAAVDRRARSPRPAPLNGLAARWTFDTDARDDFGALHAQPDSLAAGRLQKSATTRPLAEDIREKTLEVWLHAASAPAKTVTLMQIRNRSGFRGAALDGIQFNAGDNKKRWLNSSTVNFRTEEVNGPEEETPAGGRIHFAITYAAGGHIRLYRNGRPYGEAYRPDPSLPQGGLQTYGQDDAIVEFNGGAGLEIEEARLYRRALSPEEIAASFSAGVVNDATPATAERAELARQLAEAREQEKLLPQAAKAFAAQPRAPEPTHLLIRGDVNRKGDVMAPSALSCLGSHHPGDLALAAAASDADRRRALAAWIASDANPLFWRVIVNRIWHHHFGAGFVENPNDFGYNGGRPSHPELLDELAASLRRSGGSLKSLHRGILLSAAYRRAALAPRRLSAEAVRDSMLQAAGLLNPTMYGPSFRPFEIRKNSGSYHSYEPVDSAAPELQRRTIYRMNVNSGGNPMLDALDCPLPSVKMPRRSITTTPLQALSLMNNPFVARLSQSLAARVTAARATQPDRVELAFHLVLNRPPRPEEAESAAALAQAAGLEALCWGLFNTSEFLYAP